MIHDYIFLLGREIDLSLAELRSIFGPVEHFENFAFITAHENEVMSLRDALGGTIKIGKILSKNIKKQELLGAVTEKVRKKSASGKKLRIAIDTFVPVFSSLVFKVKDVLKEEGFSIRVVQHEGGRVKTATTLHEKLLTQGFECMIVPTREKDGYILAETVWVQDIDAYSKRDMDRERSMVVGMMPPKIAQIMINLATGGNRDLQIWDPFCGLGTTMIEAWHGGYKKLIATDISEDMVVSTRANIGKIGGQCSVSIQDARKLDEYVLKEDTVLVTEGMLGKNFTPATLTHRLALEERQLLTSLYGDFLNSASKNTHITSLVFCLPFWNAGKDIFFMPEVEEMSSHWCVNPLCKNKKRYLQHVRPGQCVGREIVILYRKDSINLKKS